MALMTPSSLSLWTCIRRHPDPQAASSARGVFNDIILEESAGEVGRLAPAITPCHGNLVVVDIDVSPFDNSETKKEGVRLIRNSMAMPPSLAMWWKRGALTGGIAAK